MTTKFRLGDYHKYMIADKTDHGLGSPVQDTSMPLYLGTGPETPTKSFTHGGRCYVVRAVMEEGHELNPFPCPLVIAVRA